MTANATTRPSEVFARRLRETRNARELSQAELAGQMTEVGRPMNKAALLRIESGERGLSLDEALALAYLLGAAPAHLLSPRDDEVVWLTDKAGVDGEALRDWFRFGGHPLAASRRARFSAKLEGTVLDRAQALVDASRGNDRAGVNDALAALGRVALAHRDALEADDGV